MKQRGQLTQNLWRTMWLLSLAYLVFRGAELFADGSGVVLWLLSIAPFSLFLIGVARDSLHWVIWFCLLLLFYFVIAVEAVFARPNNILVVAALADIVLLFSVCTAYIRFRGRELRHVPDHDADLAHDQNLEQE